MNPKPPDNETPSKEKEPLQGLSIVPTPSTAPKTAESLSPIVEAIVFAANQPISMASLQTLLPDYTPVEIQNALDLLRSRFGGSHGIHLVEVASGFQFRTAPSYRSYVINSLKVRPQKLSRAALETLSIIAYRQPLTRPEVDEIRGVDSAGSLKTLLERRLLRILGRKEEPGRPVIYGTSKEFLEFFGLKDLKSLPSLSEFKALNEEETASEIGKPEESWLPPLEERQKGEVPIEIIENLEKAITSVEELSQELPLEEKSQASNKPVDVTENEVKNTE